MECRQLVSVVGREADICTTGQGQGQGLFQGRDSGWSVLQAVVAGSQ